MAYGYYGDSGTSFGNTGQNNTQESFIQRQRRLQAPTQQQQQPAAQQTSGSVARPAATTAAPPAVGSVGTPVAGNGSIPPPAPAPAPAPAPVAAPAPPPPAPPPPPPAAPKIYDINQYASGKPQQFWDRLYSGDLVEGDSTKQYFHNGQGWDVRDVAPAAAAAPAAPSAPVVTPGTALAGPAEAAKSGMFTQAAPPEHDFQNYQQLDLVSNILANPQTLPPQVIEQMKQRSMEEALFGQQQAAEQLAAEEAASGFSPNGGRAAARQRSSQDTMLDAILGQNRDIEIQASQQNRQDELNAAQMSESILGGQVGRGSQSFGDVLAGQQANRGDYWTGKGQELQKYGIDKGVGVDMSRIASGDQQFSRRLGEDARQSNNQMGFNWAQLGQNGQNALMQAIMGSFK